MNTEKPSQANTILRWLASGRTLTTWQAISKWRITTTSQRVGELKKRRWSIQSRMVKHGNTRIAEYFIPEARRVRARKALP